MVVSCKELDVEGAGDVEGFGNPARDPLDPAYGLEVEPLGREHHRRITGVNPGILDMFTDGITDDLAILGNSIHFDLLGPCDELRNHHWMLSGHICCCLEVVSEFFIRVRHTHGGATENVGGSDQDRIPATHRKGARILDTVEFSPLRLINLEIIEQRRKPLSIFCTVDIVDSGSKNGNTPAPERNRQLVGNLPPHADDDSLSPF